MRKLLFAIVISAFIYGSCQKEKGALIESKPFCDTLNLVYYDTIKNIIDASCAYAGCHVTGGIGNGDFSDSSVVKQKIREGSFENRVFLLKDMPPSSAAIPLSDCDRQKLKSWVNLGAP